MSHSRYFHTKNGSILNDKTAPMSIPNGPLVRLNIDSSSVDKMWKLVGGTGGHKK